MKNLNHFELIGRLTKEPEIKALSTGTQVMRLSIANNRDYVSNNQKVEKVNFFDIEFMEKIVISLQQYLKKGGKIRVSGELALDQWIDKSGNKKSMIKFKGDEIELLESANHNQNAKKTADKGNEVFNDPFIETDNNIDNDIPF